MGVDVEGGGEEECTRNACVCSQPCYTVFAANVLLDGKVRITKLKVMSYLTVKTTTTKEIMNVPSVTVKLTVIDSTEPMNILVAPFAMRCSYVTKVGMVRKCRPTDSVLS